MKKIMFSVIILCTLWITVSIINAEFFTNIEESAKSGNLKRLQTLVNKDTDKNVIRKAIDYSVIYNRIEAFKFLLEFADEKQYKFIQLTSLQCGNVEATRLIMDKGETVKSINGQFRVDLSFEMIKLLLNNGVVFGKNIIYLNAYTKDQQKEIISMAMKNKKLVPQGFWNNVFCEAISNNDHKMVETMKSYINKEVVPRALFEAVEMKNEKLIDYLLQMRPDLGLHDAIGAGCSSIEHNRLDIFEDLLNKSQKLDDYKIESIVRVAINKNNPKVIEMLSKKGVFLDKELFANLVCYSDAINSEVYKKMFENYKYSEDELKEMKKNIKIRKNFLEWFRFSEKKEYDKLLEFIDMSITTYPQVQTH